MRDPTRSKDAWVAAYRASRQPPADLLERVQDAVAEDEAAQAKTDRNRRLAWAGVGMAIAAVALGWLVLRPATAQRTSDARGNAAADEAQDGELQRVVEPGTVRARPGPPPSVPAPAAASVPEPIAPPPRAPTVTPHPPTPAASPRPETPAPAAAPATDLADLRLLRSAEQAVRRDPGAALELLARHGEQFPDSAASLEREALTILALCGAGKTTQGKPRRSDFLREHPDSAYAARVEKACSP